MKFRVHLLHPWQRAASAALRVLAAANLLWLAVLLARDPESVALPALVRSIFFLSALPAMLDRALFREETLDVDAGQIRLSAGATLPRGSLQALRPFRVPLPADGFALVLRSGAVFPLRVTTADPAPLLAALGQPPLPGFDDASVRHRARKLHLPLVKLVAVPAVVTFILFRLHQFITYGGLLGEFHSYGLSRWLHTLAGVSFYVFSHLLIFAAALRALVEVVAVPATRLAKGRAKAVRWTLEIAAALAFYGGVAAIFGAGLSG